MSNGAIAWTVPANDALRLATLPLWERHAKTIDAANELVTVGGFGGEAAAFLTSGRNWLAVAGELQFLVQPSVTITSGNVVYNNAAYVPSASIIAIMPRRHR